MIFGNWCICWSARQGGVLGTSTPPNFNHLLLRRVGGGTENQHSADIESPPPPPLHVCTSIQPEGQSSSDLGRVLALNDPPAREVGRRPAQRRS